MPNRVDQVGISSSSASQSPSPTRASVVVEPKADCTASASAHWNHARSSSEAAARSGQADEQRRLRDEQTTGQIRENHIGGLNALGSQVCPQERVTACQAVQRQALASRGIASSSSSRPSTSRRQAGARPWPAPRTRCRVEDAAALEVESLQRRRHSRVVAWWPVPNPIDGWMTTRCDSGWTRLPGTSHGGATMRRPTSTRARLACERAAQSSSRRRRSRGGSGARKSAAQRSRPARSVCA